MSESSWNDWGGEGRPREALPRVDDLPTGEGYEREAVEAAFDAFYRHAAQLDSTLRILESVEAFSHQARELRADIRSLRAASWGPAPSARHVWSVGHEAWATEPPLAAEVSSALPRLAVWSALIVLVGVGAALADLGTAAVVALVLGAWMLVGAFEVVMSRRGAARPLPFAAAPDPALSADAPAPPSAAPASQPVLDDGGQETMLEPPPAAGAAAADPPSDEIEAADRLFDTGAGDAEPDAASEEPAAPEPAAVEEPEPAGPEPAAPQPAAVEEPEPAGPEPAEPEPAAIEEPVEAGTPVEDVPAVDPVAAEAEPEPQDAEAREEVEAEIAPEEVAVPWAAPAADAADPWEQPVEPATADAEPRAGDDDEDTQDGLPAAAAPVRQRRGVVPRLRRGRR